MKKNRFKILTVACVVGANLIFSSCVDNLLNQTPGGELASSLYWKTESDAEYAVNGVYSQARAMFNRDYVFDGKSCRPYLESDATCPVSVYGRTKLAGEQALMEVCPDSVIIRTAWLYSEYGNNFMKTVLRLGKERDELRFIFDQVGTPTYAGDLAVAMLTVLERAEAGKFIPGIYHFSDEGVCSWYDFTVKILQIAGMNNRVIPIETKDYPTPASRPHYSVLNKGKIKSSYGLTIPHWETSLAYCMNNKV